jgi:hypothetical protein
MKIRISREQLDLFNNNSSITMIGDKLCMAFPYILVETDDELVYDFIHYKNVPDDIMDKFETEWTGE